METTGEPALSNRQELESFYRGQTAYAERMGHKFSPKWRAIFDEYARKVHQFCPQAKRVLDLGCGNGVTTDLLAAKLPSALVVGADLSFHSLKAGREHGPQNAIHLLTMSVHQLPFPAATFDLVTSHAMVEHLLDADQALREMDRVLRPGGMLVIAAPNMLSPFRSAGLLVHGLKRGSFHPDGTPAAFWNVCRQMLRRRNTPRPQFAYRAPVLEIDRFLGSDYDATFLVNPYDLEAWAKQSHYTVRNVGDASSRSGKLVLRLFPRLAGGVLFAARKAPG